MTQTADPRHYDFSDRTRYDALMDVVRTRMTVRAFDPGYVVPREHYEMILEAARHAPSGANAQPWHYVIVTDQELKNRIMEYFREEQVVRAKLKMKFPTPDYGGLATAPGLVVVASDFRWVRAFPVLNDGSALDRMYKKAQQAMKPLLGTPDQLSVLDIMCFGPPAKQPYRRWKKNLDEITNWNRFDASHFMTDAQIDEWVTTTRHKAMYRDAGNVD